MGLLRNRLDGFGGNTPDNGVGGDILVDHSSGGHDGVVAYGDPLEDGGMGSNPNILAHMDRFVVKALTVGSWEAVVEGGKDHLGTNEASLAYPNAPLVLELATRIDENPRGNVEIAAEVGTEGRVDDDGLVKLVAKEAAEHLTPLGRFMEPRIVKAGDTLRLKGLLAHEGDDVGTVERLTVGDELLEFLDGHEGETLFLFGLDSLVLFIEAVDDLIGDVHGGIHIERGAVVESFAEDDVELLVVGIVFANVGKDAVEKFDVGVHLFLKNLGAEFLLKGGKLVGTLFKLGLGFLLLGEGHVLTGLEVVLVVGLKFGHLLLVAFLLSLLEGVEFGLKVAGIVVLSQEGVAVDESYL